MTGDERSGAAARAPWIAAICGVVLAGLALRMASFSLFDLRYADELMQYLEQANRLLTGQGIVPWEWRLGLRNALIPQLLAVPLMLGQAIAPGSLLGVGLARLMYGALTLLALPAAWRLGMLTGRRPALVALAVAALWWESVLYSGLILSESLGAVLLLLAAGLLLQDHPSRRALVVAGLLVGMGLLVRFQFAVFAGVLVAGALAFDWRRWGPFVCGGLIAAVIGAASDLSVGITPYSWAWVNVAMNVGQDQASRFGTAPPLDYLGQVWRHLWPIMPLVLIGALFAGQRYRPLFYAALANIAAHSLIPHKEYRFIWISVLALLVLAAIGSARGVGRWAQRRPVPPHPGIALALLIAGWAVASGLSAKANGGILASRVGGNLPRMANMAVADPGVCAIGLDYLDRLHVVPALLARPVPILLTPAPEDIAGGDPVLPRDLADGANALLLTAKPGDARYRAVTCAPFAGEEVCLYRRPGGCAPAERWSYQRMLERHAL